MPLNVCVCVLLLFNNRAFVFVTHKSVVYISINIKVPFFFSRRIIVVFKITSLDALCKAFEVNSL